MSREQNKSHAASVDQLRNKRGSKAAAAAERLVKTLRAALDTKKRAAGAREANDFETD